MIENRTPHEVRIYADPQDTSPLAVVPPCGEVARIKMQTTLKGVVHHVPLFHTQPGAITGLPEPDGETGYLVSMQVRLAAPERADLFSPGELIRDKNGQPLGCVGLVANEVHCIPVFHLSIQEHLFLEYWSF